MFYLTPTKSTCFDLEQVLCFYHPIDEKTNKINKKELIIQFKNGAGLRIKELETQKGTVEQMFFDLCKYLRTNYE